MDGVAVRHDRLASPSGEAVRRWACHSPMNGTAPFCFLLGVSLVHRPPPSHSAPTCPYMQPLPPNPTHERIVHRPSLFFLLIGHPTAASWKILSFPFLLTHYTFLVTHHTSLVPHRRPSNSCQLDDGVIVTHTWSHSSHIPGHSSQPPSQALQQLPAGRRRPRPDRRPKLHLARRQLLRRPRVHHVGLAVRPGGRSET